MNHERSKEFIGGFTVFATMAYVPFVNASVLSKIGMSQEPVFYATCLAAFIGSLWCGMYVGTPTALAPGMAFSAFMVQYAVYLNLHWEEVLLALQQDR